MKKILLSLLFLSSTQYLSIQAADSEENGDIEVFEQEYNSDDDQPRPRSRIIPRNPMGAFGSSHAQGNQLALPGLGVDSFPRLQGSFSETLTTIASSNPANVQSMGSAFANTAAASAGQILGAAQVARDARQLAKGTALQQIAEKKEEFKVEIQAAVASSAENYPALKKNTLDGLDRDIDLQKATISKQIRNARIKAQLDRRQKNALFGQNLQNSQLAMRHSMVTDRELQPLRIQREQERLRLQNERQEATMDEQIKSHRAQGILQGELYGEYHATMAHRKWNLLRSRQWGTLANDMAGDAFQGTINVIGAGLQGFGMEAGKSLFQLLKARITGASAKPNQQTLLKPNPQPQPKPSDGDDVDEDDDKIPTPQQMLISMALDKASQEAMKANTDTLITNINGYKEILKNTQDEEKRKRLSAKINALEGQLERTCDVSLPKRRAPQSLAATQQNNPEAKSENLKHAAAVTEIKLN